jgi:hypothetical protein
MPDHDEENPAEPAEGNDPGVASEASGPTPAGSVPDVPPEQRGAADDAGTPGPEPIGERAGGAGAAGGAVLESPGGPATVDDTDEKETTLAEEVVQEQETAVGEISPEMGETMADPGAGGSRFDELVAKRKSRGLTDDESEELGRLMAQRDGREWTSTREIRTHPADTP